MEELVKRLADYLWKRAETLCLAAQLVVGVLLVAYGILVVPVIPHFQLDAVLT